MLGTWGRRVASEPEAPSLCALSCWKTTQETKKIHIFVCCAAGWVFREVKSGRAAPAQDEGAGPSTGRESGKSGVSAGRDELGARAGKQPQKPIQKPLLKRAVLLSPCSDACSRGKPAEMIPSPAELVTGATQHPCQQLRRFISIVKAAPVLGEDLNHSVLSPAAGGCGQSSLQSTGSSPSHPERGRL